MARRRTLGGPPPLVLQALLLLRVADVAARAAVTPVTKVLDLLDGLLSTGKAEKHDEEVRFAAFRTWCDSVKEERTRSIDVATKALVQHEADAGSAQADADNLGAEAGELDEQMNGWEGERAKASELRKASRAEFSAADADYAESIDAIRRAIAALKSRSADVPQALLQAGAAARLSATDRQSVLSAAAASRQAPEANAYESQSGGVVGLLENLLEKFVEERRKLQVEETNRRHAHELLDQRLTDNLRQAKKAREQKVEMKASRLQDLAAAKADIKATSEAKTADETYLRDTLGACAQKSEDFERRQRLRSEELEALKQAREIIASPEVAGAANTHLPAAAAAASAASSLAQLRANAQEEPLQRSVAALLLRRSELSGSQLLAAAAGRVGEDPMAKVKQMLKDLIARLLEEAGDEADHKAWCDKELGENGETRDQKSTEVSELTARAEELTAQEAKLAQEAATLATELEELRTSVAEATKARSEESKKNAATEAEAKQAERAVTEAMRVLREFYKKAATATAFTQARQGAPLDDAPATFDSAYQGMQGSKGGVMGMLEVVQSDFARLAADTASSEAAAARAFEAFGEESEQSRLDKERQHRHAEREKDRRARALEQTRKELEATQAELDAALGYYDKLKPTCIGSAPSYADRVEARKAEIQSLQEALKILSGELPAP